MIFLILLFIFLLFPKDVVAQTTSLSISPPIFEVMIEPGKEVKQTYSIENLGGDTILTPKLIYFVPSNENGNVDLTDSPAPEWIKYSKDSFAIKNQQKINFNLIVSPPSNTPETDHLLTLIFETNKPVDILGQNSSSYKTQIGSNILLTISKDGNPKKSVKIAEFSAPHIVDSLYPISYNLTLTNNGNSFWKPIGKISVSGPSLNSSLTLAPLNIVSGYSRKIPCIKDEELIDCKITQKPLIGIYKAKLEFRMDQSAEVKNLEVTTFTFPFSIIIVGLLLYFGFLILNRYLTRKR